MGLDLEKYVLPVFAADVQTLTPAELIQKYGTHILTNINLGAKVSIYYQSETVEVDREKAAALGLTVSLRKTFGLFSGHLDYEGLQSATGNFNQKISYKALGSDVSKLIREVNPVTKLPLVNITEWQKSLSEQNSELIDIREIVPLYEAIEDPIKKAVLKSYTEQYLLESHVITIR